MPFSLVIQNFIRLVGSGVVQTIQLCMQCTKSEGKCAKNRERDKVMVFLELASKHEMSSYLADFFLKPARKSFSYDKTRMHSFIRNDLILSQN